jgi:hypothetical protein
MGSLFMEVAREAAAWTRRRGSLTLRWSRLFETMSQRRAAAALPAQHRIAASLSGRSRPIEVPLTLSAPPIVRVVPCDWRRPAQHPSHISSDFVLIGILSDCLWIMR